MVVYAKDEREAQRLAQNAEVAETEASYPDYIFIDEVTKLEEVPQAWHEVIPINNDNLQSTTKTLLKPPIVNFQKVIKEVLEDLRSGSSLPSDKIWEEERPDYEKKFRRSHLR
jgi:hypothetical protein